MNGAMSEFGLKSVRFVAYDNVPYLQLNVFSFFSVLVYFYMESLIQGVCTILN